MSGAYCSECGGYALSLRNHLCPPKWEARDVEDDDENIEIVREHDAEGAAEKYAAQCDGNGGDGPRNRSVLVRQPGGEWQRFGITYEFSVNYFAHEE